VARRWDLTIIGIKEEVSVSISILIVDDHEMIRMLLRRHLKAEEDFLVVGEAEDGREGVAQAEALLPDVVLMDVAMPGMDGIEATRLIHERLPGVKVLILTLYASSENSLRAMQSGARGYILKDSVAEEVATAIRTIMKGDTYFGAGVRNPMETSAGQPP
jgi:DNA-binding NarL/FixJ family response regulator